jgi:hypothetical protein
LTEEGLVVNIRKPKHLLPKRDVYRLLQTLWTQDNLIFIPERYRIQFTFIFLAAVVVRLRRRCGRVLAPSP